MEIEIALNGNHKFQKMEGGVCMKVKVPYTPKDSAQWVENIVPEL